MCDRWAYPPGIERGQHPLVDGVRYSSMTKTSIFVHSEIAAFSDQLKEQAGCLTPCGAKVKATCPLVLVGKHVPISRMFQFKWYQDRGILCVFGESNVAGKSPR